MLSKSSQPGDFCRPPVESPLANAKLDVELVADRADVFADADEYRNAAHADVVDGKLGPADTQPRGDFAEQILCPVAVCAEIGSPPGGASQFEVGLH